MTATVTRYVLVAVPVKGEHYRVTVTGKNGDETFNGRYRGEASTGLRFVVDGKVVTRSNAKIVKIEAAEVHTVPADEPPAEFAAAPQGEHTVFATVAAPHEVPEESDAELAAVVAEDDGAPADVRDEDIAAELDSVPEFTGIISHSQGNECSRGRVHPGACPAPVVLGEDDMRDVARRIPAAPAGDPAAAPVVLGEDSVSAVAAAVRQAADDAAVAAGDAPAEATDVYDADPQVDGKRLSEMKFAEVMKLAQKYKTPGRGVARIGALRDGVAKAIHAEAARLISAGS